MVKRKLSKEIRAGRVAGPFSFLSLPSLRISLLGVVPKKAPGEFRLIYHLSFPRGSSVNSGIPSYICSVRYNSLDEAMATLCSCGKGALMAKAVIESPFRLLPVNPDSFCLLGFQFQGGYFFDKSLPMDLSLSCFAFEKFSTFLEWCIRFKSGLSTTARYLDDLLQMGSARSGNREFVL